MSAGNLHIGGLDDQQGASLLCRVYHSRLTFSNANCGRVRILLKWPVFGSALRDDFDIDRSDVDVVVEFEPLPQDDGLRRYFDFKEQLEILLKRPVDLVELSAMENTRLKRIIERTKVPLYAAA